MTERGGAYDDPPAGAGAVAWGGHGAAGTRPARSLARQDARRLPHGAAGREAAAAEEPDGARDRRAPSDEQDADADDAAQSAQFTAAGRDDEPTDDDQIRKRTRMA